MKTILYARYSSDLQNPKSCEDQIALLTDHCEKEGWEIVGIYSDESVRGAAGLTEEARPGISGLLAHVQRGGVEQVFAEVSSRLARDLPDIMQIYALVRFYGARLFTIADGELTYITASIKGIIDASQSKATADHVKRGQHAAIMDGRCPGGIAYGYRIANTIGPNGRAVRGLRVIDDEQAEIVVRIFKEYAANESPKRIAERLNADGIPGPRRRAWKASTIYGDEKRKNGILQNRLYIGQLVLNRTSKALHPVARKERIRPNPESEWICKDKPELRIVSDELWEAVKERRAQSAAKPFRLQRRPKRLLSGLGTCATCGGPWIVIGDERWGCANRKNGHGCSNNRSITTKQFERRVLDGLQEKMLVPELVSVFVKEYHVAYARHMAERNRQRPRLEQRQLDVKRKIANLIAAIADGGGTFKEITDALAQAKAEQAQIEAELRNMAALPVVALHPGIADQYREQVRELAQALSQDEETRRDTSKVLRGLIDRVILSPKAGERGVNIEVLGSLANILSLATGKPVPTNMYVGDGAGSGNRTRIASLEG